MFNDLDSHSGLIILGVLAVAAGMATLMFNQVIPWYDVWNTWVAAQPFSGRTREILEYLPAGMILGELLVIMALASPKAIRVRL